MAMLPNPASFNFGPSVHLYPFVIYASQKAYDESVFSLLADAISATILCTDPYIFDVFLSLQELVKIKNQLYHVELVKNIN